MAETKSDSPKPIRRRAVVRATKRTTTKKGIDLQYIVVDFYLTQDKNPEDLLKRELYRYASEVPLMHPTLFKNANAVNMFLKRHRKIKRTYSKTDPTTEERRCVHIWKRCIGPEQIPTGFQYWKDLKRRKRRGKMKLNPLKIE